jgi:hypothetical protein
MDYDLFFKSQIYYLTNIVLVLTIFLKSKIHHLNMFVLLASIYHLHIRSNFYKKFEKKIPKILLIAHDVFCHWLPFIYTLRESQNVKSDWCIIIIIVMIYLIFAIKHLDNIYFNTQIYYKI